MHPKILFASLNWDECFIDFSFQSLFGRTISRICRVASTSSVKVTLPQRVAYAISPEPPSVFTQNQAQVATFDLSYGEYSSAFRETYACDLMNQRGRTYSRIEAKTLGYFRTLSYRELVFIS